MPVTYLDTWTRDKTQRAYANRDNFVIDLKDIQYPVTTLISGQDPTKLALFPDISHWQGDVDVNLMVSSGNISMLVAKMSDGKQVVSGDPSVPANYKDDWFDRNCQKAYDAKIPFGAYHYVQVALPDYTTTDLINWQWRVIQNAIQGKTAKKSFHAIILDVEEQNATDPNAATVVLGLEDKIRNDPNLSKARLLFYSNMATYNHYPSLRDQLSYPGANKDLWMAQWSWNVVTTTSWDNLKKIIIPKLDMRVVTPGYANWRSLQWTSSMVLPGNKGRTDLNFYNGTPEQLHTWLGYSSTIPEPEPEPEPNPDLSELTKRVESLEAWREAMRTANK